MEARKVSRIQLQLTYIMSTNYTFEQVIKACDESIAHWRRHELDMAEQGEQVGGDDCALCGLFNSDNMDEEDELCVGCPIFELTHRRFCCGTPHGDCVATYRIYEDHQSNDFKSAARKMREFIERAKENYIKQHQTKGPSHDNTGTTDQGTTAPA